MSTRSKYYPLLKDLLQKPAFLIAEANAVGVPRHALAYFDKIGLIERIAKGVYRDPNYESHIDITLEGLALAAMTVPKAVICLISALAFYGLTDQIPREHWLAIQHSQRAPHRHRLRVVRMRNLELGRTDINIGEYELAVFDRERCIIDAFRYLSPEIAIKALQIYLKDKDHKPNLLKLQKYAKKLRVNISPYILSLTT